MTEKPYAVILDQSFYPEIEYFDTVEDARAHYDELVAKQDTDLSDKWCRSISLVSVLESKLYNPTIGDDQ